MRFVLNEGRNRQIRRMAEAVGLEVYRLHRSQFAGISLRGLRREGEWRELDSYEMHIVNAAITESHPNAYHSNTVHCAINNS